jgi:hypothetical protein
MIQIAPSPLVDYLALGATGLVVLLGAALAWYVDWREGARLGWKPVGLPIPSWHSLAAPFGSPWMEAWPPVLAILAGLAVFTATVLTTPPGVQALADLFRENADDRALAAAYVVGAAATLGLAAMGLVAVFATLASRLTRLLRFPR